MNQKSSLIQTLNFVPQVLTLDNAEISKVEGVSNDRIQKLIELAFLAPDVIRDVCEGSQPLGLTTEWLLRHAFPTVWHDQREMFRPL